MHIFLWTSKQRKRLASSFSGCSDFTWGKYNSGRSKRYRIVHSRRRQRGIKKNQSSFKEQSKEYLAAMVQEINNGNNAVLMPVESVLELSKENLSPSEYNARFNEWMDRKLHHSSGNMGISSQYGPVKFLEDIPFPENPYQLMNSRFGLFLTLFRHNWYLTKTQNILIIYTSVSNLYRKKRLDKALISWLLPFISSW